MSDSTPKTTNSKSSTSNEKRADRVGEVVKNKQGLHLEIVEYHNNRDMEVRVRETGELMFGVRYDRFKSGKVMADLNMFPIIRRYKSFRIKFLALMGVIAVIFALLVSRCVG